MTGKRELMTRQLSRQISVWGTVHTRTGVAALNFSLGTHAIWGE